MTETSPTDGTGRRSVVAIVLGAVALVVAVVALVVAIAGDDDGDGDDTGAPTTSAVPTTAPTSTAPTTAPTSTSGPATTVPGGLSPDDLAFALWPAAGSSVRFDDPVDAARSFATDLVGFVDPVVGEFQQGDSRSGEVEVRPDQSGPVTTVLVRQLGEAGSWWVLGAVTADIVVDEPIAQSAIDHPLQVRGSARAFEGVVRVRVHADGDTVPLGEGFVTGGGTELVPFSGSIPFDTPGGGWGSVIFTGASGEDGRVWLATAVRVGFIGGD